MKELKKAMQSLADDAAGAKAPAADAGGGAGGDAAMHGKAQQRAKKADDYHAQHLDWVAQFNALTNRECAGGPGGVKWAAVRAWQQKHWQVNGLFSDGLIGPKTLEAARLVAKKAGGGEDVGDKKDAKSDGAEADAAASEKQHDAKDDKAQAAKGGGDNAKDGAHGNADAAEASAGKPKMDEEATEGPEDKHQAPNNAQADAATGSKEEAPAGDAKTAPKNESAKNAGPLKQTTLLDFENVLQEIDALLKDFQPPSTQAGMPPTAMAATDAREQGKKEKADPTKEAVPHGAMMRHLGTYESSIAKLISKWPDLGAEGRADELKKALNQVLAFEYVTPVDDVELKPLPGARASFEATKWMLKVDQKSLTNRALSAQDIKGVGSDFFHEGRHAEQRFSVARLMASEGSAAPEIALKTGLPGDIVEDAMKVEKDHPRGGKSAEVKDAKALYADTVTHGPEHRAVERLAQSVNALGPKARAMFDSLPPEEKAVVQGRWETYRARMYQVIDAYQRLTTEKDAYSAEKRLNR